MIEINSSNFTLSCPIVRKFDKIGKERNIYLVKKKKRNTMKVYVERTSAFDRYSRAGSSNVKLVGDIHHRHATAHESMLPNGCCCYYMCVEMARDTPGSPMPRPRNLGAGGGGGAATATLTSGAYHAAATDTANLHDHALQQKMLEVMYSCIYVRTYVLARWVKWIRRLLWNKSSIIKSGSTIPWKNKENLEFSRLSVISGDLLFRNFS